MRISKTTRGLMVTTAVFFDIFSAIPWVGLVFSGLGYATLWVWFMIKGVRVFNFSSKATKKMAAFISEWVAGIFGFGIWPGITAWTVVAIHDARQEDEEEQLEMQNTDEPAEDSALNRQPQRTARTRNRAPDRQPRQSPRRQTARKRSAYS